MTQRRPTGRWWLIAVAVLTFAAALAGLWGRATYGARVSADEPQYLLTATSLFEDQNLDISDELAAGRYLPYHEIALDPQTFPLDESNRQVSPHDPLLPALLAFPTAAGGWVGAKLALALIGASAAAMTAGLAHSRFEVSRLSAALVTAAGFGGLPLAPYGTQVYPELPAALMVLIAVAGLTTRSDTTQDRHRATVLVLIAVVALPWLAVKYVPVATVLGVALVVRLRHHHREALTTFAVATASGVAYLATHRWLYGGWTVYAAGDHFISSGQFSVVGTELDLPGRSRRLVGLLVDRKFGIAAWSPLWILLPVATLSALRRRPTGNILLAAIVTVTWLNASFVALTMHGWWVPGRQLVVALPVALILIARWVDERRPLRASAVAGLGLIGIVNWLWLAFETTTGRRTLIVDFTDTASIPYRILRHVLPDGQAATHADDLMLALWCLALVWSTLALGLRRAHRSSPEPTESESSPDTPSWETPTRPSVQDLSGHHV